MGIKRRGGSIAPARPAAPAPYVFHFFYFFPNGF